MSERVTASKKIVVNALFDTVQISLIFRDAYEAQVTYDDIIDRLRKGEGLTLSLSQPEPTPSALKEG